MPQTKPMMWPIFLISMNILLLTTLLKVFYLNNFKSPMKKKIVSPLIKIKW